VDATRNLLYQSYTPLTRKITYNREGWLIRHPKSRKMAETSSVQNIFLKQLPPSTICDACVEIIISQVIGNLSKLACCQKQTKFTLPHLTPGKGHAIAQAVSRWLPTAAARVQARVWSCGICGGQSGAGTGFLRVLWFPLPIFIPPIAPQLPSSIIWGLYNMPEVATVPSGLSLTPLIIKKNSRQTGVLNSRAKFFEEILLKMLILHYRN
jgi:hypothetical protein